MFRCWAYCNLPPYCSWCQLLFTSQAVTSMAFLIYINLGKSAKLHLNLDTIKSLYSWMKKFSVTCFIWLGICLIFSSCKTERISYDQPYEAMKNILQQYQNLGWHLTSIDGYNLNGQAMYAAIWEQENSPDTRKITIAKSWVDFQQEWNENVASGRFGLIYDTVLERRPEQKGHQRLITKLGF